MTRTLLALAALVLTGCATMRHTAGQPMQVTAAATPAGVATVIAADSQAQMMQAYAACMKNPASCGWMAGYGFYPSMDPATIVTNARYFQYLGLYQASQAAGAMSVLLNQALVDLGNTQRALDQSRRDFREVVGATSP